MKMNKEEIFEIWAPAGAVWSRWVKPVLFSRIGLADLVAPAPDMPVNMGWVPAANEGIALLIDLPGEESVTMGIALAARGYRPVPLYNAIPLPSQDLPPVHTAGKTVVAVDVIPIINALDKGAAKLSALKLLDDAPPAFLLDANRQGENRAMQPGEFDNRSICFTSDFPSAAFFTAHGIRRILLVQKDSARPQADLAWPLLSWQEAGLPLECIQADRSPARTEPLWISRPPWYAALFRKVASVLGFCRAPRGGFGSTVLEESAGG